MKFVILYLIINIFPKQEEELRIVSATSYHLKGKTATGHMTTKIKEPFLAVSRDLIDEYPLGSYIFLSKCKWEGKYKVLDKMGSRHTNMVDIYSKKKRTGIVKCRCSQLK
jgi:3D (Asp-Asp-Asp) domain-containing protein